MFCPQCRSEYREGFHRCADCNIELVNELLPELRPEYVKYEKILSTFNPADIAFIKSILDGEGVTYYFLGEQFNYVRPWGDPARLMVARHQVEMVKEILHDLKLSYTGPNLDKGNNEDEK